LLAKGDASAGQAFLSAQRGQVKYTPRAARA